MIKLPKKSHESSFAAAIFIQILALLLRAELQSLPLFFFPVTGRSVYWQLPFPGRSGAACFGPGIVFSGPRPRSNPEEGFAQTPTTSSTSFVLVLRQEKGFDQGEHGPHGFAPRICTGRFNIFSPVTDGYCPVAPPA